MEIPLKTWALTITSLLLLSPVTLAEDLIPKSFPSLKAGKIYAENSFAGGRTETFSINGKEIMVLVIYGSGIPDAAIIAYQKGKDDWEFVAEGELQVPFVHAIKQDGNKLMIYGDPTKPPSLLLEITAQQPSSQP